VTKNATIKVDGVASTYTGETSDWTILLLNVLNRKVRTTQGRV